MKKIVFAITFLSLGGCIYAQYEDQYAALIHSRFLNEQQNAGSIISHNHIVKEVIYSYNYKNNHLVDSVLSVIIFYNDKGDLLEKWDGLDREKVIKKYSYRFDSSNRILKVAINSMEKDMITSIKEIDYDTLKREVNMYQYDKDTISLLILHKAYNWLNQQVQLLTRIDDDSFYISQVYYYDPKGKLSQINLLNHDGVTVYSLLYKSNPTKKKEKVFLLWNSNVQLVAEYYYDDLNRYTQISMYQTQVSSGLNIIPDESFDGSSLYYLNPYLDKETRTNAFESCFYLYNKNGTLFEENIYQDAQKIQKSKTIRHYYYKE